ncbi:cyclin-dependent kinase inhibitor 1Bb [Boleophthalmus pectinirostris]|uniref:cyclin-dependent kinase inhibitor 1Bb n=1 Tax=Boleophthalmus pectinirostris TaxID=150288 RepID=UPI000A1C2EBD|nr:cyclin-dependent kinase inhibitor 1Bb [Boleophthalmus pectinirostris]
MSDVRLSNGSPTLERTDSRVPDHPKPSACRNLFGSVDHEELKRDLKGHLREMEADASDKWGFDFANNTPLSNSRLTWERVDCRTVPDFYSRQPHREKGVCSAGNNHVDLNGNHSCVVVSPSEDRSDGQMECPEQCAGMRKRHACNEHSAQSKRSYSSTEEMSCPGLSRSTEHTPRKKSPKRQT